MKTARLPIILAVFVSVVFLTNAASAGNFQDKFNKQLMTNRGMVAADFMIFTWFKQHPEYKQYESIKDRVDYFYKELKQAKQAHFRALSFAKDKKWQDAYIWAKKEWKYLNDIAVKGKKTQDNLMELESKKE